MGMCIVYCDGKIDTLVDSMHKSGVNAIYPFEVQSHNDARAVLNKYTDIGRFLVYIKTIKRSTVGDFFTKTQISDSIKAV